MKALCQMTGLNRAGFYRWRVPRQATPVEMELRDQMQKVALESPAYGYRRIARTLAIETFSPARWAWLGTARLATMRLSRRRAA